MALQTAKYNEIPAGVTPITKSEAVNFQLRLLESVCPYEKRIFITVGAVISAGFTAVSCMNAHKFFRNALNIMNYGRNLSFYPVVFAPTMLNFVCHRLFIRDNIIVNKWACPYCYQLQSATLNFFFSGIYPAIAAPIAAISYARKLGFDVPPVNSRRVIKYLREVSKPFTFSFLSLACGAALTGSIIAKMQSIEINDFNSNIENYIHKHEMNSKNQAEKKVQKD